MKKLIAVVGICMLAYILPAAAENTDGTANKNGKGSAKCDKNRPSPEQVTAKIDEHLKKLEEHKAKATSAGKTDIVNAIQTLEDALKNMKSAINAKDMEAVKTAKEQVKTAREALKKLIPEKAKEKIKEHNANKKQDNNNSGSSSQKL